MFQTLSIRRPICIQFGKNTDHESSTDKTDTCFCNRSRVDHPINKNESLTTAWNIDSHTKLIDSDTHGRLINGAEVNRQSDGLFSIKSCFCSLVFPM